MNNIELLQKIKNDNKFKQEFLDVLLEDQDFVKEIAVCVLSTKISKLGLPTPGTLLEFVLENKSENTINQNQGRN